MKRIAIAVALVGSILTGGWAYWLLSPDGAYIRHHASHQALEELAFRGNGSDELKKAVTQERSAMKEIFINRGLARGSIGGSVLLVALAVLLGATPASPKRTPVEPPRRG